jgi:GT2 family glycosyltransferase
VGPSAGLTGPARPTGSTTIDVSVVIVSYNTRALLERCLASIEGAAPALRVETIVADNGSADGSPALVRERFPSVDLLELTENRGFAHGTNAGLARATGRYHVWLNSDCELSAGSLAAMASYLDRHPDVAVVGPRLVYPDGRVQPSAQAFPNGWRVLYQFLGLRRLLSVRWLAPLVRLLARQDPMTRTYVEALSPSTEARPVDWVSGACLMARGEAFRTAGALDEGFFMYCEDADWCQRVGATGGRTEYLPWITVVHHVGASGSKNPFITYHYYRSLLRYFGRHRPKELLAIRGLMIVVFTFRGLALEAARLFGRGSEHPWWRLVALCRSPAAALG